MLPCDVNAIQVIFFLGGGGCFKCTYLNGTADYFLVPLCMIGFFHNRHGTGRESCPFISSLTQPFSEARQQIRGGWEGVEANAKRGVSRGKLLNLETIKEVSSALCLVCPHTSAALGSIQGRDSSHGSHYLPDQPINRRRRDKVPWSETLRPICSLTVILSEWQVKVSRSTWRKREVKWWQSS